MPISKRRKKKGRPVGKGRKSLVDEKQFADSPTAVTLQDLINVLAYQEYQKPDDDPTKMRRPDDVEQKETEDGQ